jgi:RNA polymerase sigma-70 factor, ECF subfamily
MLHATLLRILRDTGAAEEVLQDLFLEVWRRAGRFDPARGSPLSWLLVIGRSRALSRLRLHRRRERFDAPVDFPIEAVASPEDFESGIARVQRVEKLRIAMSELPPRQKEALELAYFEGMTQTEIADRTGSALGTVKSRVRVAMQRLKALFAEEAA